MVSEGDFNRDGKVNALDFNILATNFGTYLAPAAAATPSEQLAVAQSAVPDLFSSMTIPSDSRNTLLL